MKFSELKNESVHLTNTYLNLRGRRRLIAGSKEFVKTKIQSKNQLESKLAEPAVLRVNTDCKDEKIIVC